MFAKASQFYNYCTLGCAKGLLKFLQTPIESVGGQGKGLDRFIAKVTLEMHE